MTSFKVGDNVRRKAGAPFDYSAAAGGIITSINAPGYPDGGPYIRFNGASSGHRAIDYELVPITSDLLDVKKPCQTRDGRPAFYVGTKADGTFVFDVAGIIWIRPVSGLTAKRYMPECDIVNTPPPPVWPKKKYFVLRATGVILGPFNTKETADKQMKQLKLQDCVAIQEVAFNGKA